MIPPYSTKTCPWINPFTSTQTAHAKAIPAQAAGECLCATAHTKRTVRRQSRNHQQPHGLTAVIEGLKSLKRRCQVVICTDSQYVKNGMESWIHGWKKNGWKTAAKKPVKNDDLWKELDSLVQQHDVRWTWVKGHAGHPENEKGRRACQPRRSKIFITLHP